MGPGGRKPAGTQASQHSQRIGCGCLPFGPPAALRPVEPQAAAANGLTHSQHQLRLAVRGHPGEEDPTVGEVAECTDSGHRVLAELTQAHLEEPERLSPILGET